MTAAHTPTPGIPEWAYTGRYSIGPCSSPIYGWMLDGKEVSAHTAANALVNARLTSRNSHDALVAALEKAEAIIAANTTNRLHRSRDGADPELPALLIIRDALKAAKVQP